MARPSRAEMWVQFAAATGEAAKADSLLNEFDKRFEWYSGGYGEYWKSRDTFRFTKKDGKRKS